MRHAVILAGGGGTRLWPMSRANLPKQFLALVGEEPLLAATARRLRPLCGDQLHVVTSAAQRELVADALPGLPSGHILAEPAARNTGPAIGLAAALLVADDPDAVLAIVPSDHHIGDEAAFRDVCARALDAVDAGAGIVTIGIVPTRPDPGFGYLAVDSAGPDQGPRAVVQFTEKPDRATASRYLAAGNYLWNAGMFFSRADRLLEEFARHMPATSAVLERIRAAATQGREAALAIATTEYPGLEAVSIDVGIMEKAAAVVTIPGAFGWSDVGSWSALADVRAPDGDGNVTMGSVVALDAHDDILVADPESLVAVAGVSDVVVVKSGNAVLVARRGDADGVRTIVAELKKRSLEEFL